MRHRGWTASLWAFFAQAPHSDATGGPSGAPRGVATWCPRWAWAARGGGAFGFAYLPPRRPRASGSRGARGRRRTTTSGRPPRGPDCDLGPNHGARWMISSCLQLPVVPRHGTTNVAPKMRMGGPSWDGYRGNIWSGRSWSVSRRTQTPNRTAPAFMRMQLPLVQQHSLCLGPGWVNTLAGWGCFQFHEALSTCA